VVRSRELGTFAMLMTGVIGLWTTGGVLGRKLDAVMHAGLAFEPATAFDTNRMLSQFAAIVWDALLAFLPLLLMFGVAALVTPLALGGWMFSTKSFSPDFSRMSPISGLGRLFSAHSLVELAKAIAKSLLVGGVGAWMIWRKLPETIALMDAPIQEALLHMMELVLYVSGVVAGSLILVAALDVPWQLYTFHKKLRMTKEEIKQEMKETDGDPHIKARIRQQQRAIARRRMMAEVPKADVVVTNPRTTPWRCATRKAAWARRAWWPRAPMKWPRGFANWPRNTACRCCPRRRWRVRCIATSSWVTRSRPVCTPPWPRSWPGSIN
jgi:flagellar biosynthetic protein FlhB